MNEWLGNLSGWLNGHPQWLGMAVFLTALVECLAIVGILVPGTVMLFAIAMIAGSGALPLGETLLLGYIGGLCGDAISYAAGRRFHQGIRQLPGLRHHPEWLAGAERYFRRYGIVSLLVGRFIGPLRPMLPMVAGMCDMPLPRFIAVSVVAAAGWSVAYLLPGWAAGAAVRLPLPEGFWPQAAVVAASLAVLIGANIHFSVRGDRKASLIVSGLSVLTVAALMIGWPYLSSFDHGLMTLVQEHRGPVMDRIEVMFTLVGNFFSQWILAGALCALLLVNKQWRPLSFALLTMGMTALGNHTFKALFTRMRPDVLLIPISSYSMPSGHSSASFALFLTLGVLAGRGQAVRQRLAWLLIACLPALGIALSRVYLGAHWPTDVVAGALLASAMCASALAIMQWQTPLPTMPPRVWWQIGPILLGLIGFFALWAVPHAIKRYMY